jgi:hypothetical protein
VEPYTDKWGVDTHLDNELDAWRDAFLGTWLTDAELRAEADPSTWAIHERMLTAAPEVFRAMVTLQVSPTLKRLVAELGALIVPGEPSAPTRRVLLGGGHGPMLERLDIEVAQMTLQLLKGAITPGRRNRSYLALLEACVEHRLSEPAALYFGRCARLLLLGLDLETAIMCRASLEAALSDRLHDTLAAAGVPFSFSNPKLEVYEYSLDILLSAAVGKKDVSLRIFDEKEAKWAYNIKKDGNDAAHAKFKGELRPDLSVLTLGFLLEKIFPYHGEGEPLSR